MTIGRSPLMVGVSCPQGGTVYSDTLDFNVLTGELAILLKSTAGNINVTQQCSLDKQNWYDPVNSGGASVGWVALQQPSTTGKYLLYTPVLTKYVRYKVVENGTAPTTVSLDIVFQEA